RRDVSTDCTAESVAADAMLIDALARSDIPDVNGIVTEPDGDLTVGDKREALHVGGEFSDVDFYFFAIDRGNDAELLFAHVGEPPAVGSECRQPCRVVATLQGKDDLA